MTNYNHLHKLTAIALLVIFATGCATLFKGSSEDVNMDSAPPAEVYINGEMRGETPLKLNLKTNDTYTVQFKKDGYETKTYNIGNSVGAGWVVLDIVGGVLPVVVDAATGSWYSLDEDNIDARLEKESE